MSARLSLISDVAKRTEPAYQSLAGDLLESMLDTSLRRAPLYDNFGAHVRDGGWRAKVDSEVSEWFEEALVYARDWALSARPGAQRARTVIAKSLGDLVFVLSPDVILAALSSLAPLGFWPEGWIAAQRALRSSQLPLSDEQRQMLAQLIELLAPKRTIDLAKAHLFSAASGLDIAEASVDFDNLQEGVPDPYTEALSRTEELGRQLCAAPELEELLPALLSSQSNVAGIFGAGLGQACPDPPTLWNRALTLLEAVPEKERDASLLLGILGGVVCSGRTETATAIMDQVEVSAVLRPLVPCFVLNMPADDASLDRLERALCHPDVAARQFVMLARSHFQWEPQWAGLSSVILGIARLADGAAIACRILCGRIQSKRINQQPIPDELLECARRVLIEFGFGSFEQGLDNDMATLARLAFSTDQNDPRLSVLIEHFFGSAGQPRADWFAFDELLTALFRLRPEECLDACFSGGADDAERSARVLHQLRRNFQELVPAETSLSWAGHDAAVRCPLLARAIKCFMPSPAGGEQWSDFALSVLSAAPNRRAVLDVYETHFIPSAFSTARSDILEGRRRLLSPFLAGDSLEEQAWAQALDALMAARAAKDRIHEAKEMTGFEY